MRERPLQRLSRSCNQTAQQGSLRCCTQSAAVLCCQAPQLCWPNASAYCPSHALSACGLHQKACRVFCRTPVARCQVFALAPARSSLSRAPCHTFHVNPDLPHPTHAEFHSDGRASCILAQFRAGVFQCASQTSRLLLLEEGGMVYSDTDILARPKPANANASKLGRDPDYLLPVRGRSAAYVEAGLSPFLAAAYWSQGARRSRTPSRYEVSTKRTFQVRESTGS